MVIYTIKASCTPKDANNASSYKSSVDGDGFKKQKSTDEAHEDGAGVDHPTDIGQHLAGHEEEEEVATTHPLEGHRYV